MPLTGASDALGSIMERERVPMELPRGGPAGLAEQAYSLTLPLTPGMTLKNGRYRLLQPYHLDAHQQPQGGDPPLMIALDGELANGRVLIQELPLHQLRPQEAERARRALVPRLQALGQTAAAPKLLDHFAQGTRHFAVFELPAGDLLLDRMHRARGPLQESVAVRIALQILDALAIFEQQHPAVIHGNLGPASVVLRPSGSVMLVGLSPTLLLHPNGSVVYGPAGGVPGYAAPEQARGYASTRTDLFAICAVLQHAVTGVAPTPHAHHLYPPARHLNPNVSLELEEVLGRGLRPSAAQRFASAAELRASLAPLASGHRTLVPEELWERAESARLTPIRDAKGRLTLPRRRSSQNPLLLFGMVLLTLLIVGAGALVALAPRGATTGPSGMATPNQVALAYQAKGIGLSAGDLIFDKQRPDSDAKQAGARAISAGDLQGSLTAFNQAVKQDQSDAEAAIYAADTMLLASHQPFVSVVAAVAFGDDDAAARSELQGVFLAQQRVNQYNLLPSGVQVRVLILNSGAALDDVKQACDFLLDQVRQGNTQHLVGIVGWPRADQTHIALNELKPSGLAVVSPTAVGDHIAGYGANFFPIAPADSTQGAELADAVAQGLGAQRVLVLNDTQNQASDDTSKAFFQEAQRKFADTLVVTAEGYTSGSNSGFSALAGVAHVRGDDLIFLACGDHCDADTAYLAQAVAGLSWPNGSPPHILADSHAFSPALVGQGGSDLAQLIRNKPAILSNVYVTLLADRDEWNVLTIDTSIQPTFPDDYGAQFGLDGEPSGLPGPDQTSILAFDAAHLLLAAGGRVLHVDKGVPNDLDPSQVRLRLLQYDGGHPFMGVSGALAFTITGAQLPRALLIERLELVAGTAAPDRPVAQPVMVDVVGGKSLFCGSAPNCSPS
jgi:ABC-type branched-subunit amino acid transport system substrate-binding protein